LRSKGPTFKFTVPRALLVSQNAPVRVPELAQASPGVYISVLQHMIVELPPAVSHRVKDRVKDSASFLTFMHEAVKAQADAQPILQDAFIPYLAGVWVPLSSLVRLPT
jgi:hypothetical protein